MEYVIEKGVPITENYVRPKHYGAGLRKALRRLEVGDSVLIRQQDRFGLSGHARAIDISVTARIDGDYVRVWRLS